ncbi:hypothetical protein B484DRAFT_406238 [Ochromonadaceae sp. CCMP2298]|nr:hypothetical protein B484DRAFT_406238 [Ochromonadaceae sp. CCMP2298]
MSELAGMLLGGGLVLVASTFVAATGGTATSAPYAPEADQEKARETFGKALVSVPVEGAVGAVGAVEAGSKGVIVLAPKVTSFAQLKKALNQHFPLLTSAFEAHAILDLRKLTKHSASFEAERQLQRALLAEGLVLIPGECCGASPGLFRLLVAPSAEQVGEVVAKLVRVGGSFKWFGKRGVEAVAVEGEAGGGGKRRRAE